MKRFDYDAKFDEIVEKRVEHMKAHMKAHHPERLNAMEMELSKKQERIVQMALELLKHGGLENLTLRKVAAKVNLAAPAIYWHFKNKVTLIDYMAEAILQKELKTVECGCDEGWDEWLRTTMTRLYRAMMRYPDGGRVVAGAHLGVARTLGDIFEVGIGTLNGAGMKMPKAASVMMTAVNYTFGFTIEAQASRAPGEAVQKEMFERYPMIGEAMRDMGPSNEERFVDGLELIIRGAE